jgi:pimeloyl-ACP methyl ester carboxylesterase
MVAAGAPRPERLSSAVTHAQSTDGVSIAYTDTRRGDATIVFIHGWSCDQSYWSDQISYFAKTHRVIAVDLAGHGQSGTERTDWTVDRFADDVVSVVRAAGATRVILVGHSLGGPVAVEAALKLEREVAAVVGIDTFFDSWTGRGLSNVLTSMRADFVGATTSFVRTYMFTPRSDTALARRTADAMARARPEVGVPALASLVPWATNRAPDAFAALRVPLGVLQSSAAGHTQLQRSVESLQVFESRIITGAGHFPMLEDGPGFNILLDSLIRRLQ